ncbi:putative glycoside hydrolase [Pandoraea terrigena]|uniref:GTP-binding protein n=1 Tax=Pandoraea terrigena TaxID=2508292 RepID=A0A5E4WSC1_9BURK|nr:putative glycoside hydrolase [Pandoraea terrigena]VVE27391.1 GTP-binding protein [Pandoraea terrigena]
MINRWILWSVALLCLHPMASATADSLAVTAVDATTRAPIAGATLVSGDRAWISGRDGAFVLPATAPGATMAVSVRAPGYARVKASIRGEAHEIISMTPIRPKAIYLSVYGIASRELLGAALALPERTAINALVIDVKGDRGMTPYPSPAREAVGAQAHVPAKAPRVKDLPALVKSLHDRGLYLIARIVVFKDDPLAQAHPAWAVRDAEGNVWRDREQLRWIDPTISAAWTHNLDVAEEAARMGFDEIQFDYLRFPDAPGLQFHETNTAEHRVGAITGFLSAARERLLRYNVYLSVDIFGYVCWNLNDTAIGQQLETLGEQVDYISPMLYPSGFTWGLPGFERPTDHPGEIVSRSLAQAIRRTGLPGVRFRPWLQAFRDYAFDHRNFGAAEIRAQTDAADAAGTDGWMLWNPRNRYEPMALPR